MIGIRRVVLLVLLMTVPFQAALGATGMLCGPGTHHAQQHAVSTAHAHDIAMGVEHHHGTDAVDAQHDSAAEPGSHDPHRTDVKCKVCGESCCSTVAIPASAPDVFPSDTFFWVSSFVDPDIVSRAGDGLFRPPRT